MMDIMYAKMIYYKLFFTGRGIKKLKKSNRSAKGMVIKGWECPKEAAD